MYFIWSVCVNVRGPDPDHRNLHPKPCCPVCPGCRQRRMLGWSSVSRLFLWGVCPRSPVSVPAKWSCAVKDCWSSAPPSCRAYTSVSLTSTRSCRTGTCVFPGTGRAELERHCPSCRISLSPELERSVLAVWCCLGIKYTSVTGLFVRCQVTTDVISDGSQGKTQVFDSSWPLWACPIKSTLSSCWKSPTGESEGQQRSTPSNLGLGLP